MTAAKTTGALICNVIREIGTGLRSLVIVICSLLVQPVFFASAALAADQPAVARLVWSDYPGWQSLAALYDNSISTTRVDSTSEAIEAYQNGQADIIAVSQVDLLFMVAQNPSAPDTVVLFPTSFSAGADGIIAPNLISLEDIAGKRVGVAVNSVSHFALSRALGKVDLTGKAPPIVIDIADTDLVTALSTERIDVAVSRAPFLNRLLFGDTINAMFDSREMPEEIIDLIVMRKDFYEIHPEIAERLSERWYQSLAAPRMNGQTRAEQGLDDDLRAVLSSRRTGGTDSRGINSRAGSVRLLRSGSFKSSMLLAKAFVDARTWRAEDLSSLGSFGMEFVDGVTIGDPSNIRIEIKTGHIKVNDDGLFSAID